MQIYFKNNNINKISKWIKHSKFFLFVSFINSFTPIFLCMIASFINPYGAQAVMGIGYVSAFLITFAQIGVSFATSTFFNISKKLNVKSNNLNSNDNIDNIMNRSIYISFIMGITITTIFIVSAFLYLNFSSDRPNTALTLKYGLEFVYSSIGYILLICINSLLILYIKIKNVKLAASLQFISMIFILLLAGILGVHSGLGATGIGIAITIVSIITSIIIIPIIIIKYPFKIKPPRFMKINRNSVKEFFQESISGIALSFFKGVAILILSLSMPVALGEFVPLSYQMSRVIWFNLMSGLAWVSIGFSDTIKYIEMSADTSSKTKPISFFILSVISMFLTSLFCIMGWYIVEPLATLYTQNGQYDFSNLDNLPKLPNEIEWVKDPDGNYNIEYQIKNNIELKKWLSNPSNLLELFPKWMFDYIGFTSYNPKIITALLNYNFDQSQISLIQQFALDGYNSKSTIYIFIYAILFSGWTIMLPATAIISKKNVHWAVICSVYAAAIAFLIGFGVNYSILDVNKNNLFRFLDAWTFPLMMIAIAVSLYIWIKWIVICTKYKKNEKYEYNNNLHNYFNNNDI